MSGETIAVVGGTGNLGAAIAWRLARAGHPVIIGSRARERRDAKAAELGRGLTGMANAEAAAAAAMVIVTVPFAAQEATLADISPHVAGKIVVDTTVPLVPPKVMRVQLAGRGQRRGARGAPVGGGGDDGVGLPQRRRAQARAGHRRRLRRAGVRRRQGCARARS